ncbi:MAG TPA: glycine betaine ABC transporter substrate-binding protein [Pyrinomonadaceae bacterium]
MLEANAILQNRYMVVRPIGKGGMGTVYLARDQRLRCTVALKETLFGDDSLRQAFEHEAELLANMRHAALPKVIDHFVEGSGQFLVMEYIEGDDLAAMMEKRGKPFPPVEVISWADQLLDALDYLHTQEPPVLHRDIKPQNLKLTRRGQIILLDFGLAKGTAGQMSVAAGDKSIFGFSPTYAPLEQIKGTGTGPRSDLYSLGAALYHLLTNTPPVPALTRASEVLDGSPDPLRPASALNPEVPQSVAAMLTRAMALKRDSRPSTAAQMRLELRAASSALVHWADISPHLSVSPDRMGAQTQTEGSRTVTSPAQSPTEVSPPTRPDLMQPTVVTSAGNEEAPAEKSAAPQPGPALQATANVSRETVSARAETQQLESRGATLAAPPARPARFGAKWRFVVPALVVLMALGAYAFKRGLLPGAAKKSTTPVTIASKNFAENTIIAEILAQMLEERGLQVRRSFNLDEKPCHDGLVAGRIDAYPEYTGTSFTAIFRHEPITDAEAVYEQVKREYAEKYKVEVASRLGFRDDWAILVRGDDARRYKLRTISDAVPYAREWRAGSGPNFLKRPDGYAGLVRAYGLKFALEPLEMDLSRIYTALASREVDMIVGNSTDGLILALNLVQLEDDRHYFPPYEAVILARQDTLAREPSMREALQKLNGVLSSDEMRWLNYEVDGKKRNVAEVVRGWRQVKGL